MCAATRMRYWVRWERVPSATICIYQLSPLPELIGRREPARVLHRRLHFDSCPARNMKMPVRARIMPARYGAGPFPFHCRAFWAAPNRPSSPHSRTDHDPVPNVTTSPLFRQNRGPTRRGAAQPGEFPRFFDLSEETRGTAAFDPQLE